MMLVTAATNERLSLTEELHTAMTETLMVLLFYMVT